VDGVIKNLGRGSCSILKKRTVKKLRVNNNIILKLPRLTVRHSRILITDKIQAPYQNLPLMIT